MHIIIERVYIFRALQNVLGFVGGARVSIPILGHVLLQVRDDRLFMTGSDADIEIVANIPINEVYEVGETTVPARKIFNICRMLSNQSKIILKTQNDKLFVHSEDSFFSLATFSVLDFPSISSWKSDLEFFVASDILKDLIELTQFSMGKQDVRYYLNGMLFKFDLKEFCVVATDGYRLAFCRTSIFLKAVNVEIPYSIIIPRKYILNLLRILNIKEKNVKFSIGKRNISITIGDYILTSKLINGVFPDYRFVFSEEQKNVLEVNCQKLLKIIRRSIILCHEKFHVVKFLLSMNQLKVVSSNSENEISEQILDVIYVGRAMEIGFNVYYILDILNAVRSQKVQFLLIDENSSVQIVSCPMDINIYVIMPIRL